MIRLISLGLLLSLSLLSLSCHHRALDCGYKILGPNEFTSDSYFIRQGQSGIKQLDGEEVPPLPDDALDPYLDVLAEDDVLNIVVYHPSRLDWMNSIQFVSNSIGGFRVTDGQICLPDLPPIEVVGLSLSEARQKIKNELLRQLQGADVFVSYLQRVVHKVDIAGFVPATSVPVNGKMRLFEVLALAHLPAEANLFSSYISRDGVRLNVDFYKLMKEGDMSQNIVVKGGDKIFIGHPSDSIALIMGEVMETRPIMMPNGHVSLREALAMAHGIPYTGNKNRIQVIRGGLECPKIYLLSWNFMLHEQNENLLLMPGDIVYVSRTAIADWNLILHQIAPTAEAFFTVQALYLLTK